MAEIREKFDFCLVDAPAGLGQGFRMATQEADHVVVVTTTDVTALRDAQRTVSVLRNRIPRIHLVVNRVQPRLLRRLHTTIDDAMDAAGLPLLGVLPEDPRVMLAANLGKPLTPGGRPGAAEACTYTRSPRRMYGSMQSSVTVRQKSAPSGAPSRSTSS